MAGYSLNLRNNPPEYSQTPSADSVYGTQGTNTPGAQQNQQNNAAGAKPAGADPYQMFRDAPMGWPAPPPKPGKPGGYQQPKPGQAPGQSLSSVLNGGGGAPAAGNISNLNLPPGGLASVLSGVPFDEIPPAPVLDPETGMWGTPPAGKGPPPQPVGFPINQTSSTNAGGAFQGYGADQSAELGGRPDPGKQPPQGPVGPPILPDQKAGTPPMGIMPAALPVPPAAPPAQAAPQGAPQQAAAPTPPPAQPPPYDPNAGRNATPPPAYTPPPQYNAPQPPAQGQSIGQQNALAIQGQAGPGGDDGPIIKDPGDPTGGGGGGTGGGPAGGGGVVTPPPAAGPPRGGRPAAPVTDKNDWLHADANGNPWSITNLPPNPGGTEDPAAAAHWYMQFNFLDPSLINVTPADVVAFRTSGFNPTEEMLSSQPGMLRSAFLAWWQHGKPTPAQTPPAAAPQQPANTWTPDQAVGGVVPQGPIDPSDPNYARIMGARGNNTDPGNAPATPPPGAPPPPAAPPPPGGPPAQPPPGGPPAAPPAPPPDAPPAAPPINIADTMRGLYGGLFGQEQSDLARTLRAQAAYSDPNLPSTGGFQESLARGESNLINQEGARLADYTNKALDRAQQLVIAQMDDATTRFGIKTQDDLQRWLNSADSNTLQKYGIDKNDLLQRYLAKVGLQGHEIDANATINAAALHAAAAEAAANAQTELGKMNNNLGWAQLQASLYMSGQQNYVTELGYLMNAGLSPSDALAILGIFGGTPPAFVK